MTTVTVELQMPSESWQALWQQHTRWLRTVLVARLRDQLAADEVLQEVAVIAWQKHDQLADPNKAAPWLYRIAIRQTQMFWRSQKRDSRIRVGIDEATDTSDHRQNNPLEWILSQEAHDLVRKAMAELTPRDREILMLKHSEDWTYQQIADHIGISRDKVIYRLERARKRLRAQLGNRL